MTVNYKKGEKDTRPWGDWEVLDVGENYIVKRIRVLPDKKLSLQMHHHRVLYKHCFYNNPDREPNAGIHVCR